MDFNYQLQPGFYRRPRMGLEQDAPLISIVTAFYNSGKVFEQTYQSVVNQTFPYYEWIIVDDGSTDPDSLKLLEALEQSDYRIRVFHKKNEGPVIARNVAIRQAKTEYIYVIDSDDLIEPPLLEYLWWMLEHNQSAAWAYSASCGFGTENYQWNAVFDPELEKTQNLLPIASLIRRAALEEVGLFYENSPQHFHEDWYLWLTMLAKGKFPVQSRNEPLFWYRRQENSRISLSDHSREGHQLIKDAGNHIVSPREPIIFPQTKSVNWKFPQFSHWQRQLPENGKTNILFLFPWLEMGGADKFNYDLIAGLDKDRYEAGIITTVTAENVWQQMFRTKVSDMFNLPNFMAEEDYGEFITYYIKSRNVKILFLSNSYHGYGLLPWLREQFPDLVIVDYVHMEEWYWKNGGYARVSGAMKQITEKTYVCNSGTYDILKDYFGRDPQTLYTAYIGVDEKLFHRDIIRSGVLYEELQIPECRPVVLFICRMHPQKRPFLMLEIAKRVKQEVPNVAFVVVGDGPQYDELRRHVKSLGMNHTVYFLGAKKEVRPYYKDAKVTLISSLKEGLALTAYESCAMGVPVVSADVGGQKDLIDASVGALIQCRQNEETDFDNRCFEEQEIQDYTQAIVRILTDEMLWNTLSRNCRNKIENGFTINAMVQFFEKEFDRLLADSTLQNARREKSAMLQALSPFAAEYAMMEFMEGYTIRDSGYSTRYLIKMVLQRVYKKIFHRG